MQSKQSWVMGWRWICITLLIAGIVLRFVNLDTKIYWHDEVATSRYVTVHPRSEVVQTLFTNREVGVADLQPYQQLVPDRGISAMIQGIAKENPQHPPLYILLLRGWITVFGNSIASIRSLSAVISLLTFPCIFWLCLELFHSATAGWLAIALVSISPLHLLYAQEAREYSLWTVAALLCSAALLRALRLKTRAGWLLYTASLVFACYTHLLSGLLIIGHGVYVLANDGVTFDRDQGLKFNEAILPFLTSTLYAVLMFLPWILCIVMNFQKLDSGLRWTHVDLSIWTLMKLWAINLSRSFIDFNFYDNDVKTLVIVPVLVLEALAIYSICRHSPKRIWLFILTLLGSTTLPLICGDIFFGGQRSIITRYMLPAQIGLQLLIVWFLSRQASMAERFKTVSWQLTIIALLIIGGVSCSALLQADTWWNKGINYHYPQAAKAINASDRPLIITDAYSTNPDNVIVLSYLLSNQVRFLLLPEIELPLEKIPVPTQEFGNVFLLNLPSEFLEIFSQQRPIFPFDPADDLWVSHQYSPHSHP